MADCSRPDTRPGAPDRVALQGRPHVLRGQVQVNLGARKALVAQELANRLQRGAATQQVGGARVTQHVGMHVLVEPAASACRATRNSTARTARAPRFLLTKSAYYAHGSAGRTASGCYRPRALSPDLQRRTTSRLVHYRNTVAMTDPTSSASLVPSTSRSP